MEVDIGKRSKFLFDLKSFQLVRLDPMVRASSICLPYSLVPGISTNSPLYFKALATLSKRPSSMPASTSASPTASEKKVVSDLSMPLFSVHNFFIRC